MKNESRFHKLWSTEFYGYDLGSFPNCSFLECEAKCLQMCDCKGFHYSFSDDKGYKCYPKTRLVNGRQIASFAGDMYLRLPKTYDLSREEFRLNCSNQVKRVEKTYN